MTGSTSQQEFLQAAMDELALGREAFAERIGCPYSTFKKWVHPDPSSKDNFREMPSIAWAFVREVLAHKRLKRRYERLQKTRNSA